MFLTPAHGKRVAPLPVHPTLCFRRTMQDVASIACEVDHVVQVELAAVGAAICWVARVSTSYGCVELQTI